MNTLKGKKAVYYTLGCKLNFAETSAIGQQLKAMGVEAATGNETADICIVNTCSVTEVAESKGRQAISRFRRRHPGALMVVTGCYKPPLTSALLGENFLFVDGKHKGDIANLIVRRMATPSGKEEGAGAPTLDSCPMDGKQQGNDGGRQEKEKLPFVPACACGERTRFFLKVQDGCDYFCTYCTIPFSRGRSRNGSIDSLARQAEEVAQQGGKEIVLTGVNTGDYGKTTGEKFIDLLRALDKVEGIERYRISSIEPNLLTEEIIQFCAESRAFMPHFHIPLQSGSDEVLRLMHRRYDTTFFAKKIEEVRRYIPESFIGVDVIVGMRGETDELFAQSHAFMKTLPVSQFHVFSYSERPGTKALQIPGIVSPEKKHERSQKVISLSEEKLHTYYNMHKGQTRPVLLEHSRKAGVFYGFTDNYIRVEVHTEMDRVQEARAKNPLTNTIVPIRLGEWNETGDALIGSLSPHREEEREKHT